METNNANASPNENSSPNANASPSVEELSNKNSSLNVEELYVLNYESQTVCERETGKMVYWGLDRSLVVYDDDDFSTEDMPEEEQQYCMMPWSHSISRAFNIPDGILIGFFYSDILKQWVIFSTGEHTMRIIDNERSEDEEEQEEGMRERPWGKKYACIDISKHPHWDEVKKIFQKEKVLHLIHKLKEHMCYTFFLSSPSLRTTGPEIVDMKDREEDLGYGLYQFLARDTTSNFTEKVESILGVKQPLLRAVKDKENCLAQINMCGTSNVGIYVTELQCSRGRVSCRKCFFFNPVWKNIHYLYFYEDIQRRDLTVNPKTGDLEGHMTSDEEELMTTNPYLACLFLEFILHREVGVIQTYISLREKYLRFIQFFKRKIDRYVNGILCTELGDVKARLQAEKDEWGEEKDVPPEKLSIFHNLQWKWQKQEEEIYKTQMKLEREFFTKEIPEIYDIIMNEENVVEE